MRLVFKRVPEQVLACPGFVRLSHHLQWTVEYADA